ncbi:Virulence protein SSD1 [Choanephora cucurbitarum]|uniref:Virulence protein SSD1 n=1 Tax=Choanephora cucurbitarum TaxID=101091 RepID=A0A1C7N8L5_9FUNG|nr:Virulence protein SSD1 [Choanephora cucurbitarum]
MENYLDLNGQTAPESTRGLFDTPETFYSKRNSWTDKRKSAEARSRVFSKQINRMSGLHTVNEEGQQNINRQYQSTPINKGEEPSHQSREDALAEAEAKLNGHHPQFRLFDSLDKQNRRLSAPNGQTFQSQETFSRTKVDLNVRHRHLSLVKAIDTNQGEWRIQRPKSIIGTMNRLSTSSSMLDGGQRKPLFISHFPFSSVVPQLKSNTLVSGTLRVNKRNRSDAYVFCDILNADIYICGSRDRNRALEGDHVAIKLIEVERIMAEKHEKEEAKLARNNGYPVIRKPDEEDEKEIIFGGEQDVDQFTPRYCGVVVAILDRMQKQSFSGTLGLTRPNTKRSSFIDEQQNLPRIIWFKPTDKRVPLIAIPIEQAPPGFIENSESFDSRLFLGSVKRWPITSLHPFGVLENELGSVKDVRVQLRSILADNNLACAPFPESISRKVPIHLLKQDKIEKEIETKVRRDFRSISCITIEDQEGFLDNALSIVQSEEDLFEIGLHVTDLTAFVESGSVLDKEARLRGMDVYHTILEKIPLWPDVLRTECTDLVKDQTRLTFSVVWTINRAGEISHTWYGKSVICPEDVMTLPALNTMIQNAEEDSLMQTMFDIAQSLRQRRQALLAQPPQVAFILDDQTELPQQLITENLKLCSDLVLEEFQTLANTQIAQKICQHFPDHALLQSQSAPNEHKLNKLVDYLGRLGYAVQPETPDALQQFLDTIEDVTTKSVITALVMKTMNVPKYFCTGALDISRYHHYSMNAPLYTHFTCPTKRYADTIVHRQLEAALDHHHDFSYFMDFETIQKTVQQLNVKMRAVEHANLQTQHLFSCLYLSNNTRQVTHRLEQAVVVGVQEGAFDVIVPKFGLERRIHTINLPLAKERFTIDQLELEWIQGKATINQEVESGYSYSESSVAISKSKQRVVCIFPQQSRQLIRPFHSIQVVITADPARNPPLIRVLAANPFL